MPQDKKVSTVDFLNNIDGNTDVFKEEPAVEEVAEDVEEDKPLPFHKDPKLQRYIEKQVEKGLKDRPSAEQQFRREISEDDIKLPPSLVRSRYI